MLLRLILVGLVTSMGFELPNSRDVSCWTESGRAWANASFSQLSAPEVPGTTPVPPVAELAAAGRQVDADRAYQAAVDQPFLAATSAMTADFVAEQTAAATEIAAAPTPAEDPSIAPSELVVTALPDGEEVATVVTEVVEVRVIEVQVVTIAEPTATAVAVAEASYDERTTDEELGDDAPSRSDRLASAVRLTREAAHAWATLIQDSVDATEATDATDCTR